LKRFQLPIGFDHGDLNADGLTSAIGQRALGSAPPFRHRGRPWSSGPAIRKGRFADQHCSDLDRLQANIQKANHCRSTGAVRPHAKTHSAEIAWLRWPRGPGASRGGDRPWAEAMVAAGIPGVP
jgi:hypothetical protein